MNIEPKNFDFGCNGVYVIIEVNQSIPFSDNSYKVIGVTRSLNQAKKYSSPNRIIKGPVPYLDNLVPEPRFIDPITPLIPPIYPEFTPKFDLFEPIKPKFDPFETAKPKFDFFLVNKNKNDNMDLS